MDTRSKRKMIPYLSAFSLLLSLFATALPPRIASAQEANFGINLSGGKEPVELKADDLEMRDQEGMAIFSGNVSVVQGNRLMRTSKLVVYYAKKKAGDHQVNTPSAKSAGLGSTGVERMEASGKVYIKTDDQVATGDTGLFDAKTNIMTLSGSKVVLTDGKNVAAGCKLIAHMDSGKAFLQSCGSSGGKGRVSIIMNNEK